ncbi:hypothetical protein [Helicobacter sp. T3_23-1056]
MSLRESATLSKVADSWQSTKEFCHTERSEVSQSIYSSLRANAVSVAIYLLVLSK